MRAHVFANGAPPPAGQRPLQVAPGDLVIAADGGAVHCRAYGLRPQVIVGDFDSLAAAEAAALAAAGSEILRHPADKDHTDLDLALQLALERGAGEVLVYGAFGRRWDMSLSNVLLALAPHLAGAHIAFVDGDEWLWPLRGPVELTIHGRAGDRVSLIPLCGDASGIRTRGLAWPLDGETLPFGSTRGISNVLAAETATIELAGGLLLCVHAGEAGEPGAAEAEV